MVKFLLLLLFMILFILVFLTTPLWSKESSKKLKVGNHYFTSTWCGPCRTQTPIIKRLQKEGFNIKIYDNDKVGKVKVVPTIIIVKKDKTLKLEGLQTYEKLKKIMVKGYKLW